MSCADDGDVGGFQRGDGDPGIGFPDVQEATAAEHAGPARHLGDQFGGLRARSRITESM